MFENIHSKLLYKNFYNGKWTNIHTKNVTTIHSPLTNETIGKIECLEKHDIDKIIHNSIESQIEWAKVSVNERCEIIHKAATILQENIDAVSNIMQKEICKSKKDSIAEIKRTADFLKFTADEGKHMEGDIISGENFPDSKKGKISLVTRAPVGLVLAISPFNYPINLSASKIAPALVGGNSVLFKPSIQSTISSLHLVEIFNRAGVPKGVLNTVTGTGSEIGDYLVTHKDINFINFTGSSKVGKHIAVIAGMVPMLMELGGKDAAIILEDADLNVAANNIVKGAFSYSGQRCTAIKRVIVLEEIADSLVDLIHHQVVNLKVGNPEDNADITPLINNKAADYVLELCEDALNKGAKLLVGNKRNNNLIYPTLLDYVTENMRIAWEEPFGPILPIIRVKDIEHAINVANKSDYGLQSSVFTESIDKAFYVANKLEVGTVQINNKTERGPDNFPFLGTKSSGMGTQGIKYSIEAMTRPKSIVLSINQS